MAVLRRHLPYYFEIFSVPGLLRDPVLTFGYQTTFEFRPTQFQDWSEISFGRKIKKLGLQILERIEVWRGLRHPDLRIPREYWEADLNSILRNLGLTQIEVIDLFDKRANYQIDMNKPAPAELRGRYNLVMDIGSTEHVFDTRQCLENLIGMTRVGGHLVLQLPCKGCFDHGFHTFSPECILSFLELNGFAIVLERYSTFTGVPLSMPEEAENVLLWCVAKKESALEATVIPQQGRWRTWYKNV